MYNYINQNHYTGPQVSSDDIILLVVCFNILISVMLLDNPNNSKPKSLQNGSRFEESFIRIKRKIQRNSRTMLGMGQEDMPLILYFDV